MVANMSLEKYSIHDLFLSGSFLADCDTFFTKCFIRLCLLSHFMSNTWLQGCYFDRQIFIKTVHNSSSLTWMTWYLSCVFNLDVFQFRQADSKLQNDVKQT